MKCPCCQGEIILDTLARSGELSLDVKCNYCKQTGKVNLLKWFDWKIGLLLQRGSKAEQGR